MQSGDDNMIQPCLRSLDLEAVAQHALAVLLDELLAVLLCRVRVRPQETIVTLRLSLWARTASARQ